MKLGQVFIDRAREELDMLAFIVVADLPMSEEQLKRYIEIKEFLREVS